MTENNNKNEHDIIERRVTFGPGVKAIAMSVCIAGSFGSGFYICKDNTKGDIAESEINVRRADGEKAIEIEEEYNEQVFEIKENIKKRPYDTECANMSIRDMRAKRMRELEEH